MEEERPHRVQLRRTKGWRMPPNTVNVARPTQWGNPYKVGGVRPPWVQQYGEGHIATVEEAIYHYRAYLGAMFVPVDPTSGPFRGIYVAGLHTLRQHARIHLKGKNLACWCPLDQPCHADVLLELANGDN